MTRGGSVPAGNTSIVSPYLRRLHEIIYLALYFASLGERRYYLGTAKKKGGEELMDEDK